MDALAALPSVNFAVNFSNSTARVASKVQTRKCQDLVCRLGQNERNLTYSSFKTTLPQKMRFLAGKNDFSSAYKPASPQAALQWVLEPVGDGDSKHLDEKVAPIGPVVLTSDTAVVGRVPEKADIVFPVATVSGSHARLEKKGEKLYVTDLDSTNGTYVGDRKLRPGSVTEVSPGSFLTFGDEHLAQFRFTLVDEPAKAEE